MLAAVATPVAVAGAGDGRSGGALTLVSDDDTTDGGLVGTVSDALNGTDDPTATPTATPADDGLDDTIDDVEETVENASGNVTDAAGNASEDARDRAETVSDAAQERADNVSDAAQERAGNASDAAQERAGNVSDAARDRAENGSRGVGNVTDVRPIPDLPANATPKGPPTANATVNATAGRPASVPVGAAAEHVGVSRMNVTLRKNATVRLNVTSSDDPPADAPAYGRDDGGVAVGHIRVNHSVPDSDISNVTFTFSVAKDAVADANATAGAIALYRYHGGNWSRLPTTLVGETNGSYVYRAESPGLSDFTAAARKPKFEVAETLVSAETVRVDEAVGVRVRIRNVGDADGTYTTKLLFDGAVVDVEEVTIAADGTRQVTFEESLGRAGEYEVRVNDVSVGTLQVEATPTATAGEGEADSPAGATGTAVSEPSSATETSGAGFGALLGLLSLCLLAALLGRR